MERSRAFYPLSFFSVHNKLCDWPSYLAILHEIVVEQEGAAEMLTPALKSIYQKYKADTDLVAEWLAVTAKTNGYEVAATTPTGTGGRLKGKARKLAKAGAAKASQTATVGVSSGSPGNGTAAPKSTHLIKIKDFEALATFVSKVNDLKIPKDFVFALDRVIAGQLLILSGQNRTDNGCNSAKGIRRPSHLQWAESKLTLRRSSFFLR